jgi:hypothetical protein
MSTYATEFELSDDDDDALYINRCVNENHPLMVLTGGFRYGVELYRDDVERLVAYLASVVDKVPARPPVSAETIAAFEAIGFKFIDINEEMRK